jgi:hypothetical protein
MGVHTPFVRHALAFVPTSLVSKLYLMPVASGCVDLASKN